MPKLKRAKDNLSRAVSFPTISHYQLEDMDLKVFSAFEHFLLEAYPLVHEHLKKTIVNNHGLVFFWPGQEQALKPYLLTAHYDVVPVLEEGWPHPPFSGFQDQDKIWGRGTLDDKSSLIAILESVEALLAEDFTPPRDVYLAFGFDEECNGYHGAGQIAQYFKDHNIHFDCVLDEGGAVTDGSSVGISRPVAVIGLAEKGNSSFRFSFKGEEGHSSTPPAHTALGKMAAFIHDVESHPQAYRLTPLVGEMLKSLATEMSGPAAFAASRPQLFAPLLKKILAKNPQTQAMLRTTVAFTMADCGQAPNVLPLEASCVANVRILQGDSVDTICEWFKSLGHDFSLEVLAGENPTKASSLDGHAYQHLVLTITQVFPEALALPYLMTGGTDCRHYEAVTEASYRFMPAYLTGTELKLMHGTGEFLSYDNLENMLKFYESFLRHLPV